MKRLLLTLALMTAPAFAGDLYQHFQLPMIDVSIDSGIDKEPDLPGMGKSQHFIYVSMTSIDSDVTFFSIYIRVKLADGNSHPILATLYREAGATTARFSLGSHVPVKIEAFHIVRMHAEPADQLVHLGN